MGPRVVRFTLVADDIVDVQNFLQRPLFRLITAIGLAALVLGLFLLVLADRPLLALGLIAYGTLDLALVHARSIRRWAAARRGRRLLGTAFQFELVPEHGLRWTETGGNGELRWSSLTELREDERLLAFMAGGVLRATIPKRAFETPAELAAFRDEARSLVAPQGV
jgi:hypothetical protein